MDPDPGGPKTRGSGFGSATLQYYKGIGTSFHWGAYILVFIRTGANMATSFRQMPNK
jgi:hypothetical protein